jgi:2-polyprenyl-6-methoxyphenol hydroxylase-like FAD-dependent oxidoreductase
MTCIFIFDYFKIKSGYFVLKYHNFFAAQWFIAGLAKTNSKHMLLQHKKVAVVGGGPGGLTLAVLLQQKGIDVKVYERDTDRTVRQQGATLDLHQDSGLRALAEAGLIAEFKKLYRPGADRMRITDSAGRVQFDDHAENAEDDFTNDHFRPEIDRGPLRDMLIGALSDDSIVWNAKFTRLEKNGHGWRLLFEDGHSDDADIVIAADGVSSKLRSYITDIAPVYSGITIVEGTIYNAAAQVPRLWDLVKGGKVFALGSGKSIILSAKGEGSLSFYTGTREAEQWVKTSGIDFDNKEQVFDWFGKRFADWSSDWHELFAGDESYFVPRPQYHFPLDQQWKPLPNLTMLGDAAHRMPPYAGEGVNMAMQDALELYEALCSEDFGSIADAIASFEKQMCSRAAEITGVTIQQTDALHSEDNLKYLLSFFQDAYGQQ